MSSISLKAGDTSWTDSITCDLCGVKVERKDTGELRRVELSITDPRQQPRISTTLEGLRNPVIEYMERRFEKDALVGWGSFNIGGTSDELGLRMDMCPSCAGVEQDSLLERSISGACGTYPEVEYGKEVPIEVGYATTNLGAVRELGEAIAPPGPPGDPGLHVSGWENLLRRAAGFDRPPPPPPPGQNCIWGRHDVARPCGRSAMAGAWYCYEHAARSAP